MKSHVAWALLMVAAFVLGLQIGQRQILVDADDVVDVPGAKGAAAVTAAGALDADPPGPDPDPDPALDSDSGWSAALDRLDELRRRGGGAAESRALLAEVLALAREGDAATARARLDGYLARNPFDGPAHLLDSDIRQMRGQRDAALEPLLALLEFADEPGLIREARDKLELLVNVRETELANRGDTAGLIRYFEELSRRDPGFDRHRLRLAHWQLQARRLDDAERTLAETGSAGTDPRAREALLAALVIARTGLPVERATGADGRASALHVRAVAGGRSLRLLVDTGATTTTLSRSRVAELGARRTGQRVSVRTAGGVVEAELWRLGELEVGALQIDGLDVLVLEQALPEGVDGLLGMDVLGRFQSLPGGMAGGP